MPRIDQRKCVLCGKCVEECPNQVLELQGGRLVFARPDSCTYCTICEMVCPHNAVVCEFTIQWTS